MEKKPNKIGNRGLRKVSAKSRKRKPGNGGEPNPIDVLNRVPVNRNARIKDLPNVPVFSSDGEKQRFLNNLAIETSRKDWREELQDAAREGAMQMEFSGFGNGNVTETMGDLDKTLTYGESQRIAEATNERVQKDNLDYPIAGQAMEPNFILPPPAAKLDENDIPEYVLNGFVHPIGGFKLVSTVTVGKDVRIVYHRDTESFEAVIAIGAQRTSGNRRMEISCCVSKDGATYAVHGNFCDHPLPCKNEVSLSQPRAMKLYDFLCEKLALN